MAVVKIDDGVLDRIKEHISADEFKLQYPSIKHFIHVASLEKMENDKKEL